MVRLIERLGIVEGDDLLHNSLVRVTSPARAGDSATVGGTVGVLGAAGPLTQAIAVDTRVGIRAVTLVFAALWT